MSGRDCRGSGELTARGELLGVPAARVTGSLRSAWSSRQSDWQAPRFAVDAEQRRYERTRPEHLWNSHNVASSVLLYHLQRHGDHHANPMRRYQPQRHSDEAPQPPTGYAGMIVLPGSRRLWRHVMDHRLLDHCGADLGRREPTPARAEEGPAALRRHARRKNTVTAIRCPVWGYVYDEAVGDLRETLKQIDGPVVFMLVDIWISMARTALQLFKPHLRSGAIVVCDTR